MSAALADLRAYVTAETGAQNRADSTVLLTVTHSNLRAQFMELRFDLHVRGRAPAQQPAQQRSLQARGRLTRRAQMSVLRVKEKLQTHVGSSVGAMRLTLRDENGAAMAQLEEEGRPLGFYGPRDGCTLHVTDSDAGSASAGGWLEDLTKVEKFRLSDAAYDARQDSFRRFAAQQRAADPAWTLQRELAKRKGVRQAQKCTERPLTTSQEELPAAAPPPDADFQAAEAAAVTLGARCEVTPGGKRGTVCYVGRGAAAGAPLPLGFWVGVRYDEPVGRNDGSLGGVRSLCSPCLCGGG